MKVTEEKRDEFMIALDALIKDVENHWNSGNQDENTSVLLNINTHLQAAQNEVFRLKVETWFDKTRKAKGEAIEVPESHFDYSLNVLPPIYGKGFFGISEAYSHTENDGIITFWFCRHGEGFYSTFGTKSEANEVFTRLRQEKPLKVISDEIQDKLDSLSRLEMENLLTYNEIEVPDYTDLGLNSLIRDKYKVGKISDESFEIDLHNLFRR